MIDQKVIVDPGTNAQVGAENPFKCKLKDQLYIYLSLMAQELTIFELEVTFYREKSKKKNIYIHTH